MREASPLSAALKRSGLQFNCRGSEQLNRSVVDFGGVCENDNGVACRDSLELGSKLISNAVYRLEDEHMYFTESVIRIEIAKPGNATPIANIDCDLLAVSCVRE